MFLGVCILYHALTMKCCFYNEFRGVRELRAIDSMVRINGPSVLYFVIPLRTMA